MKTPSLACGLVAALAASFSLASAAPVDDVKAAADKLADAPNYTWTTTTTGGGGGSRGGGGGAIKGVAEKDGYAVITADSPNGEMMMVSKDGKQVIKTSEGWVSADEMRGRGPGSGSRSESGSSRQQQQGGERSQGGPGGGRGPGGPMMMGATLPAEDMAKLIAGATFTKSGDAYVAELSADAIASQLRPGGGRGGNQGPSMDGKGTLKVWIKGGVITKTELHITGSMTGRNGEQRSIERTVVTEFSDVGSTTVTVPEEAKAKLGA